MQGYKTSHIIIAKLKKKKNSTKLLPRPGVILIDQPLKKKKKTDELRQLVTKT